MSEMMEVLTHDEVRQRALDNLAALGFDGEEVEVFYANAKALRESGMLLDLDITGLTIFDARISWTLDLGVGDKDSRRVTKRLRPGRKNLLANTKLQSIGQRIRENLATYSQAITIFPGYRYVPYSAFIKWYERHQELVKEWDEYKAWILESYEQIRADCRADFAKHARDTWAKTVAVQDRYDMTAFEAAVVSHALSHFPSKARIEAELNVILKPPATFLLESEYQNELLLAQRTAEQRRTEQEKAYLDRDYWARKRKADAEQAESEAEEARQKARAAEEETASKLRVIAFEEEEQMKAIKAAQVEIARKAVAETVNPLLEIVEENRKRIYATLSKLQVAIGRRGWVHGKEANAIRSLADWFQVMNITGDDEMATRLEALRDTLGEREDGGKSYDAGAVLNGLGSAIETALQEGASVAASLDLDAVSMMDL